MLVKFCHAIVCSVLALRCEAQSCRLVLERETRIAAEEELRAKQAAAAESLVLPWPRPRQERKVGHALKTAMQRGDDTRGISVNCPDWRAPRSGLHRRHQEI